MVSFRKVTVILCIVVTILYRDFNGGNKYILGLLVLISELTGQKEHKYREMECQNPKRFLSRQTPIEHLLLTPTHECLLAPLSPYLGGLVTQSFL